jgi:hypothetical protein
VNPNEAANFKYSYGPFRYSKFMEAVGVLVRLVQLFIICSAVRKLKANQYVWPKGAHFSF